MGDIIRDTLAGVLSPANKLSHPKKRIPRGVRANYRDLRVGDFVKLAGGYREIVDLVRGEDERVEVVVRHPVSARRPRGGDQRLVTWGYVATWRLPRVGK